MTNYKIGETFVGSHLKDLDKDELLQVLDVKDNSFEETTLKTFNCPKVSIDHGYGHVYAFILNEAKGMDGNYEPRVRNMKTRVLIKIGYSKNIYQRVTAHMSESQKAPARNTPQVKILARLLTKLYVPAEAIAHRLLIKANVRRQDKKAPTPTEWFYITFTELWECFVTTK